MNSDSYFEKALTEEPLTAYNMFEPWDTGEREQWLYDLAEKDGVKLPPNRGFQTSAILDDKHKVVMALAGNQVGKSMTGQVLCGIFGSGQVPLSLRHDKGVDTGVERQFTLENKKRYKAKRSDQAGIRTLGKIQGAGKFQKSRIPNDAKSQILVCTYKMSLERYWKPKIHRFLKPHLDLDKGVNGWSESKKKFFFKSGRELWFVTYEQDYHRVESVSKEEVPLTIFDEEPPDRRFYSGVMEHTQKLYILLTPINGLSWMFNDIYLPALSERTDQVAIYHATQFDCPFHSKKEIEKKRGLMKDYEIKPKIYGVFAEAQGKPYYSYQKSQAAIKQYIPKYKYVRIYPMSDFDRASDLLNIKMNYQEAENKAEDTWEVYEDKIDNASYWISCDAASGAKTPDTDSYSAAYVRRLPMENEKAPVMVASLHTLTENIQLGYLLMYASVYYNGALIAPEATGADGHVVLTTMQGYPYVYIHTLTGVASNGRPSKKRGFWTTGGGVTGTRQQLFDLVGEWFAKSPDDMNIWHYPLIREFSELIVGKGGRPDHPKNGTSDCLIAFGISEYVYKNAHNQIRNIKTGKIEQSHERYNNINEDRTMVGSGSVVTLKEKRPCLGTRRGLDARRKT